MSPRPRFFKLDDETRRHLLDVAAQEFAANGYEGASLNRIIERSNMSKGALYYYFDDKADLFATVVNDAVGVLDPVRQQFELDALDGASFWDLALKHYGQALQIAFEQPAAVGVLRAAATLAPEIAERGALAPVYAQARSLIQSMIERGQAVGAVRTDAPDDLILESVMAVGQAAELWLVSNWDEIPPEQREDAIGWVFSMFRRVAQARPEAPESRGPNERFK